MLRWVSNVVRCAQIHIHALSGFRKQEPSFRAVEDSKDVAHFGYCDRPTRFVTFIIFINTVLDSALLFFIWVSLTPFQ
jgi:hypothetical protein